MIILPDKNIVRTKFLMPVPEKQWRTPSQAQPKDVFGVENHTRFHVTAKLNDGHPVWRGIFESRDDFDAFIWAIITKKLKYQRELWNLPTPSWNPELGVELTYIWAVSVYVVTPTGSLTTFPFPADYNSSNNSIECIGAGGSGGVSRSSSTRGGLGGGGGGYSKALNVSSGGASTTSYQLGTGGTAVTSTGTLAGTAGGATWFGSATQGTAPCAANGGSAGPATTSTAAISGGAGGGGGLGTTLFAGGAGGSKTGTAVIAFATGGGGAGGPTSNGVAGVSTSTDGGRDGGAGGSPSGGTAGTGSTGLTNATAGAGGNGTGISASPVVGSGGGGGGNRGSDSASTATGGAGGNYGGGGGGACRLNNTGNPTSGAGAQGVIVVTYTPASLLYNMPFIGT